MGIDSYSGKNKVFYCIFRDLNFLVKFIVFIL